MRLRKASINYLGSELIYYKHLSRGIERISNNKVYPSQYDKQKVLKDRRLKQLTRIKEAIEYICNE